MWKRRSPTRSELIERKRRLQEQINAAAAEVRRLQNAHQPTEGAEARLAELRDEFVQTRLAIDRAPHDS